MVLLSIPASQSSRWSGYFSSANDIRERIKAGMRRRKLEGYSLGRAPLSVDHPALVRDRLSGMSLTQFAKKYSVSRASVVRFTREATMRQALQVCQFHPVAAVQAPAECVA